MRGTLAPKDPSGPPTSAVSNIRKRDVCASMLDADGLWPQTRVDWFVCWKVGDAALGGRSKPARESLRCQVTCYVLVRETSQRQNFFIHYTSYIPYFGTCREDSNKAAVESARFGNWKNPTSAL
jgi:hypothetical protein